MAKIHLVKDESMGGVQREYIEVAGKAKVGDYAISDKNNVFRVKFSYDDGVSNGSLFYYNCYYRKVIPTNTVHIDGVKYRLDSRKADVGETVLVFGQIAEANGVQTVDRVKGDGHIYYESGRFGRMYGGYYVLTAEQAEPTPDIHDLLANLAQRVTSLERITGELVRAKSSVENKLGSIESQLNDAMRNIERQAQELEGLKDLTESNTKDIAFLDDRTYEKPGKPTKSAEVILRDISKLLERGLL